MKAFLTAITVTIAVPAAAQTTDPAHSAHNSAPAPAPAADGKADAGHNDGRQKKAGSTAADRHAGHDMSKADPHAGHKMGNH